MSKALFAQFETDKNIETGGILINYGAVRFRIARAGGSNRKYGKVFKEESKPFKRQIDNDQISDENSDRLVATCYAKAVILGWESNDGTEDAPNWVPTFTIPADKKAGRAEDEVLDFNVTNVVRVLLLLPELFADLREQATLASNFRKEDDEADAKN